MPLTKTEKANPSKGGGAKPWVYRHALRDHDRQAAEEKSHMLASLEKNQARFI